MLFSESVTFCMLVLCVLIPCLSFVIVLNCIHCQSCFCLSVCLSVLPLCVYFFLFFRCFSLMGLVAWNKTDWLIDWLIIYHLLVNKDYQYHSRSHTQTVLSDSRINARAYTILILCLYCLPPTKEDVVFSPARPSSFICLCVCKITQKGVHRFGWNVACRHLMSGHGRTD